jgi:hypothetical protein
MAILPWSCSDLSISRESASFVEGSAITSISTNIENALQFCLKISLLRCLSIIVLSKNYCIVQENNDGSICYQLGPDYTSVAPCRNERGINAEKSRKA